MALKPTPTDDDDDVIANTFLQCLFQLYLNPSIKPTPIPNKELL